MATLTIPDVPDDVIQKLEVLARKNNRTIEDEARYWLELDYWRSRGKAPESPSTDSQSPEESTPTPNSKGDVTP